MDEFQPTSLLILAASIDTSDPWVMDASSGAVTLTPFRMMAATERRSISAQSVILDLTDLGHVGGADGDRRTLIASPLRSQSRVVLLLPWSLLSSIAVLDNMARSSSREIPRCYASDDWLSTWHHFIEDGDWEALDHERVVERCTTLLPSLPFFGSWHFVLALVAASSSAIRDEIDLSQREVHDTAVAPLASSIRQGAGNHDPLTFTNPGSPPEGLSPLFSHGRAF
jgi:hypothetical protein